jgi:hypothetical protein
MATAAAAGVRGGASPLKPTSAPATGAGREAAVAGLVAKTTDTATADTTTAATAGVRGGPSPLEPPSAQPKHDPVRGAGHEPVAGEDEEQQREAQLQDHAQQREAQQSDEEEQLEALRVPASGAACGAGAATAAAKTNEAAAGGCDGPFPKQASVEARLHGAGCGAGAATAAATAAAATNEAAAGGFDGPVSKQAEAAADASALAEQDEDIATSAGQHAMA